MRRVVLPVVLLALVTAGGAAAVAAPKPTIPTLSSSVHAWDTTIDGRLVTALVFENPNPYAVKVQAVHYDVVDEEGTIIGEGLTAPRQVIPAEGRGVLVLRTRVADDAAVDPEAVHVEGTALATAMGLPLPVPFTDGPDGGTTRLPGLAMVPGDPVYKNS